MKISLILSSALLAGTLLSSCSKDNSTSSVANPNPSTGKETSISYQLHATNASSSVNRRTTAGTLAWTSGFANPTYVKFQAMMENTKIEYKSTNKGRVDLFAPNADFGSLILPTGLYKKIELKIRLEGSTGNPALQLYGTYTDNGITIPIQVVIEEDLEFKTKAKDVYIDGDDLFTAITTLDLSSYTDGVTLAMLQNATITNGTLVISKNSNRALYNIIVDNLAQKDHDCDYKHKKD